MLSNLEIVPAAASHIPLIAPRMRPADREEVWASAHMTPEEALRRSLQFSTHAWTAFIDGEPLAMWGVAPINLLTGVGAPWLQSTDTVDRHPMTFLRYCRRRFHTLFRVYPTLRNYVDDRHTVAKHWLAWLGFILAEPKPWGVEGRPFRLFELKNGEDCHLMSHRRDRTNKTSQS